MDKLNGRSFALFLMALAVVLASGSAMKGGLFVDQHEGDMLHLIDIVLRMEEGQFPHRDFVTPLGTLAFAPFSIFVSQGMGVGAALIWGQIAFAALVVPMVWWVAISRLNMVQAYVLATATLITLFALIYGGTDPFVSMSMHYNRWAWALAFVAVPIAVMRPVKQAAWVDGIILGLAMSFFIFGKVTYAVALAPGLIVALAGSRQWAALGFGVVTVALVAGVLAVLAGPEIFTAYLNDLRLVSGTDIRPRAGETWFSLLFSPKFIVSYALLVGAIVWLRLKGDARLGAILAVFAPGFAFIAYQNFGNDPKWLIIVAVLLLGTSQDRNRVILALVACVLIAPSFVNMAFSPFRHTMAAKAAYVPAFDKAPHGDFMTLKVRDQRIQVGQPRLFESAEFASLNMQANNAEFPTIGEMEFPPCLLQLGLLTSMRSIADDLEGQGIALDEIFTADTFGSFWMFGTSRPTTDAAPWYYGRLSGFDAARYVLVPICAITPRAVKSAINDIAERAVQLREVRKTELYVLYEKS